jgi:hypothetical protein
LPEVAQPARDPTAAVGQERRQRRQGVGAVAVAHDLDVGGVVGVDRRGDRQAAIEAHVLAPRGHAEDGLAVGAHGAADRVGQPRQRAAGLAAQEQLDGAQDPGRQHDLARGRDLAIAGQPRAAGAWVIA